MPKAWGGWLYMMAGITEVQMYGLMCLQKAKKLKLQSLIVACCDLSCPTVRSVRSVVYFRCVALCPAQGRWLHIFVEEMIGRMTKCIMRKKKHKFNCSYQSQELCLSIAFLFPFQYFLWISVKLIVIFLYSWDELSKHQLLPVDSVSKDRFWV